METYEGELGPYTTDEIEALPEGERAELIDGMIFMMDSPTFIHQSIAGILYHRIRTHIESRDGDCIPIIAPFPVYLDGKKSKKQWFEPDVFVAPADCSRGFFYPCSLSRYCLGVTP